MKLTGETKVTTNDGYDEQRKLKVVQHWQLIYKGFFVADTSVPEHAAIFEEMAAKLSKECDHD